MKGWVEGLQFLPAAIRFTPGRLATASVDYLTLPEHYKN